MSTKTIIEFCHDSNHDPIEMTEIGEIGGTITSIDINGNITGQRPKVLSQCPECKKVKIC